MSNPKLIVSSSPHIRDVDTIPRIMHTVNLSLLPAVLMAVYYFGFYALMIILTCVIFSVLTEAIWQKLRGKEITISDGSAILTGLLLALTLPPRLPLWMAALGAIVAISIGKQVFGGLGYNPFNPALVGRAFLLAAFSVEMTTWYLPGAGVDATSTATPLALMKMSGQPTSYWDLFIGNIGGSLGETSALAIILGGAYLIYKGYVDYRITIGYLGTVAVLTAVFGQDPIFHLLSGGLVLGGFYMLTDMVTSPITKLGRWIYGIGAGVILVVIRLWGGYPEGVLYSILLMNMTVPLLNRYTRPRTYGEVKQ
ncbi:electron transporter RnfD [Anoxybacter fermentans]|uniref:Ion-translocating oxidoreductase complex subunit D n=1 Tax=Anoxybacter fermentans TaxID=1323375 RepID=A0A3S9SYB4_9FIRM|nr:RnfABCDGE type electron transport complex subunit D [Anoxybacter fermentans]AZR73299.1 electron transporter RnfD [Anoxybacter fermentans]